MATANATLALKGGSADVDTLSEFFDLVGGNQANLGGNFRYDDGGTWKTFAEMTGTDWYTLSYDSDYRGLGGGYTVLQTVSAAPDADTNGDGVVDAADYIILKRNMGQSANSGPSYGDFDNSGTTDWDDLQTLISGMGAGGGVSSVPEPATLGLLALGALAAIRRRRTR